MFKFVAMTLFAASLTIAPAASALADEPVIIKFSHVVSDDTPKGKGARLFQKLVQERLAGKVKVEVYPNSTLYGDEDELDALIRNDVQMLAPSLSKFDQYTKQLEVFDMPFLFDDMEAVKRFQRRDKSRELLGSMASHGIYGLAYWNNGMKQLTATRELRKPDDAKNLAFRIQASNLLDEQFKQIGAKAVKLPFNQSYKALKSGQVQGTENTWSNLYSQKINTVQPYITESNHGVLAYMLITNSKFWNSLPFAIRSQLEQISDEVTQVVNKEAESINAKDRENIVNSGSSKLISLTAAERAAWRKTMAPLLKSYEAKIGADVLHAAQLVNRR
ncbi:C4-dicarboxylate-binding protein DctP [Pseudomonas duriflava]|uniref:C4-dicarboxylate-binding protein DctP n=1 Tax=Pseudomonas duriflava TaxID=459528 RepID=A0A562QG06_9PSED|nr:TRAP transporter substrate-binding protein [Pseudomonas duriflava]TWI55671.1 C4-dicarboxylate-binding protein DctP [Pseudomonas duriflava]